MSGETLKRTEQVVAIKSSAQSIDTHIPHLSKVFKLLGDETRLRIALYVSRIELNVGQLCSLLNLSQPLVSTHIGMLRNAGVLQMRREGKHHFYSLRREPFAQLMDALALGQPANPRCDCFLECMLGN